MPVIAIVGAVSERCLAIARFFAARRFRIAFLSANPAELTDGLHALAWEGVEAEAFAVDVRDPVSIAAALAAIDEMLGPIDVLEGSADDAIAVAYEVLPDMLARRSGTIVVTTGAWSPGPAAGGPPSTREAVASASARAWAHALHNRVARSGVQVAHIAIGGRSGGEPAMTPEGIAAEYWELHTRRDEIGKMIASLAS